MCSVTQLKKKNLIAGLSFEARSRMYCTSGLKDVAPGLPFFRLPKIPERLSVTRFFGQEKNTYLVNYPSADDRVV